MSRIPTRTWCAVVGALLLTSACGNIVVLEPGDPAGFVRQPLTSQVLAADGSTLADLHAEQDRREVRLEDVPDDLVAAVVAVEDRRFFLHRGVDVPAIARAAVRNVESGAVEEGGSTITQQYVKNTMLGPVRTLERKVKEAALAYQLEERYTKEEILERYLNTIYFGHGAYGVHAAAERYFAKSVGELTLADAALLAGLIASPATYDPYAHPEAARRRRRIVLDALVATGQLESPRAEQVAAQPLGLAPLRPTRFDAPYAVEEVRRRIAADGRFVALGATEDDRLDALFTDGVVVHTTIDPTAQRAAEQAVSGVLGAAEGPDGALVALDPDDGAIRALVGGRDYYSQSDPEARFNLATQGRRQAGSAFKPLVLAVALSRGETLDTEFPGGNAVEITDEACRGPSGPWRLENYGGLTYPRLSLREATVQSVNTVYARLVARIGPQAVVDLAEDVGLTGLDAVCSIALGAEEVSPLGLTAAYQTFTNLGVYHEPYLVQRIVSADGDVLYEHDADGTQVIDEAVAYLVTQTLSDVVGRGTGVRAAIDRPQAGKTGTTDENADAWFVGYTPDLVAGVWVGFAGGSVPMVPPRTPIRVEGGRWPAEIWAQFARIALADVPPRDFESPAVSLVTVEVDVSRNCLPNPYTPPELVEPREYLQGTQPTEICEEPAGPPVHDVPAVVGLTRDIAVRVLQSQGYRIEERAIASRRYPPGYVTDQQPEAGGEITEGDAVVLWVSSHTRDRAAVPEVVGLPVEDARTRLEEDGWVVRTRSVCPPDGCPEGLAPGTVYRQDPAAGDRSEPHSVVTLEVVPEG